MDSAILDQWDKLKMTDLDNTSDLWPQIGEYLRYIWPDTFSYTWDAPRLTCNNEYRVEAISYLPGADRIQIIDENGMLHWIELYKFSFIDQMEHYNK